MLIRVQESLLLLVDVQTRLAAAVAGSAAAIARARLLLEAARRLDVPVAATEQYPRGIGATVPELRDRLHSGEIVEKIAFSGAAAPELVALLERAGRPRIVVCGLESHVCVLQTALGLAERGYQPCAVADAVASRDPADRDLALDRLRRGGIDVVSAEMVVFEWLERAGTGTFKALLPLLRQRD